VKNAPFEAVVRTTMKTTADIELIHDYPP